MTLFTKQPRQLEPLVAETVSIVLGKVGGVVAQ
jgi:hypothetical protein